MDGMILYLLGVITGFVIVIGCAVGAFYWGSTGLNEQGEQDDW